MKGMAAGQRSKDKPASPTFVLERIYSGNISIRHIDLYRSGPDRDILESIDEGIMNHDIVVVEWGDQLPLDYQKRAIHILISHDNHEDNARDIRIQEVTN
ncbi:MAG: hypothetical protein COB59_12465 [Rhodospirillaceae bacterium]|nr:MAG: hypothetical protein COB59_12465 [Rhodospirillaceae bacterium]